MKAFLSDCPPCCSSSGCLRVPCSMLLEHFLLLYIIEPTPSLPLPIFLAFYPHYTVGQGLRLIPRCIPCARESAWYRGLPNNQIYTSQIIVIHSVPSSCLLHHWLSRSSWLARAVTKPSACNLNTPLPKDFKLRYLYQLCTHVCSKADTSVAEGMKRTLGTGSS